MRRLKGLTERLSPVRGGVGLVALVAVVGLILAAACTKEIEVVKEVPVEVPVEVVKEVEVPVEVVKEVEKIVVATPAPVPSEVKDSVTVAMSGGFAKLTSLDTTIEGPRHTIQNNVYDSLVRYNGETDEFEPMLAESWERIDDKTIRFHLKPNVKFHNGSPLTAEDVKFYIDRVKDPDVGSPAAFWYTPIDEARVVDELTVDLIGEPAAILNTANILQPIDKETFEQIGADEYAAKGNGTGPFKVVQWEPDDFIILEANQDYWGGAPKIKTLTFRFISEASTKVAMLYAGEADIIDLVPTHLIDLIDGQPEFDIRVTGSQRATFITVNTFQKPFDDVRVRQAMAYAINVKEIVDTLYESRGELLASTHPNTLEYFNDTLNPYPYDPDKARDLLAQAGYPDGFETNFDSPAGWFFQDKETSQILVDQLAQVGIKAKFFSAELSTFFDKWVNKGSALAYMACGNIRGDVGFCFRLHFHSAARGIYYNSPEIEEIIDDLYAASDLAKRKDLAYELQKFVHDNVPYIPLYVADQIFAVASDLVWTPDVDERFYLHKAEWK